MSRRYYRLTDDLLIPERWHIGEISDCRGNEPFLDEGVVFDGEKPLTAKVTHAGAMLDFTLTSFALPIVSTRLAEAIRSVAESDIQQIPVRIESRTSFIVLNTLRIVECLEESQSEFSKWTDRDHRADLAGQYRQVTKLRVNPKLIPIEVNCFRIKGWLVALVVSDLVKDVMEKAGCLGAKFQEVTSK